MPSREEVASLRVGDRSFAEIAEIVKNQPSQFMGVGNYPPDKDQRYCRFFDLSDCLKSVVFMHWGLWEAGAEASSVLQAGTDIAVDYFYGDYVRWPDYAECMERRPDNDNLEWAEVFRDGLFLGLLAGDDSACSRLAEWVTPDLPYDEAFYDLTPADNAWLKLVSFLIRGVSFDRAECQPLIESIAKARTKRAKLLLEPLVAIEQADQDSLLPAMAAWMRHYLKREFAKEMFPDYVTIEGSIVTALAKRKGMSLEGLPGDLLSAIVTRKSLGIEG
ncbi:hypothetical protein Mal64_26670 [Pseudobythopirellula maris]|uniref:Uncharacterized protein n=2 Tax=Pseudobythopirellula maris TaxID=2527991 RepID=A0A5C5ZIC7_9BACT|nr:hypothetical protein Mal64_26670 [Pseudobythopirellula maris]